MILTLEVVGEHAAQLGAGSRKVFHSIGGTIGRLPDNDWVFPDPYVSGRHALIRYLNGKFFVEDTSTNGVFINSPENRLSRVQPHPLKNGDLLFIDVYQIKVSIENDAPAAGRNDPFAALQGRGQDGGTVWMEAPAPPAPAEEDRTASMVRSSADDEGEDEDAAADHGTQWFGLSEMQLPKQPSARGVEPPRRVQPQPPVEKAQPRRAPPAPPPAVARMPERSAPRAAAPNPAPERRAGPGDGAQLQALFAAAGIDGLDPSDEAAQTLGEVLRVTVSGLMEVLHVRDRMKGELRMRGTTFKAANNNPLKFSANVDDAFHNLLVKHNPAYLAPQDAFDEAFRDVRDHQTAVLAAMRVAFEMMLAQFDPDRLQEEFDRQIRKGSILGVPAKLRYWDMYRERYGDVLKDAEKSFRELFADEFAKAYEEQLERLKALGRKGQER